MLQYHFNWQKLAAAAGITWWNFYFRLYPDAIRAPQVVDFLGHLLRCLPGKLLVVWDGLPGYAPELKPVEYLWGYWKRHELANFCPRDCGQLSYHARRALRRMRRRPSLVMAFWQQSDLFPL